MTHCDDDVRDIITNNMVTRGRWSVVGEALRRGVSDSQYRWAIDEACRHASDDEFTDYVLPHCADNQLDSVLTILVERGMWSAVGDGVGEKCQLPTAVDVRMTRHLGRTSHSACYVVVLTVSWTLC